MAEMEKTSLHGFVAGIGRAIDIGSTRTAPKFESLKSKHLKSVTEALQSNWSAVAKNFGAAITQHLNSQAQREESEPSARDKKILENWICHYLAHKPGRTLVMFQSKAPVDKKPESRKRFVVHGHNFRFHIAPDQQGKVRIILRTKKNRDAESTTFSETRQCKKTRAEKQSRQKKVC